MLETISEDLNKDKNNSNIQKIQLSDSDIGEIKKIITNKHFKLNELGLLEMNYSNTKESILSALKKIEKEEEEIAKQLKEKYGNGSIDVDN